MGHKINPRSFRIGINRSWNSFWYGDFDYAQLLSNDIQINETVTNFCRQAKIAFGTPLIKRWLNSAMQVSLAACNVYSVKSKQKQLSKVRLLQQRYLATSISNLVQQKTAGSIFKFKQAYLSSTGNVFYFTVPLTCSQLIASYVAYELRKRNPFKEVMQDVMDWVRSSKYIIGMHVSCSGRFSGKSRTRTLWKKHWKIPYSTLNAHVDFSKSTAISIYGAIGIKVWVYYNPVLKNKELRRFNENTIAAVRYKKEYGSRNKYVFKRVLKLLRKHRKLKRRRKKNLKRIYRYVIKSKKN